MSDDDDDGCKAVSIGRHRRCWLSVPVDKKVLVKELWTRHTQSLTAWVIPGVSGKGQFGV